MPTGSLTLTPYDYEEGSLASKLPQFVHSILRNLFLTLLVTSALIVLSHNDQGVLALIVRKK